MHARTRTLLVAAAVFTVSLPPTAEAHEAGDVIQVDNVGIPLYTYNFETSKGISVADKTLVSEFMGAHYFITPTIRLGMMFQFTEQFAGPVPQGTDQFSTFALLPQIGWNFYDHFSAAAIFTYAARAAGKNTYDLGVQALLGYGVPLNKTASFNAAVEIPYNFRLARTLGATPLLGFAYTL